MPVVIANQIRPADMDVNVPGHIEVHELAAEMFSRKHVERRDDPVLENLLLVINVVQKQVQRRDALGETAFEQFPLGRRE